ncbi:hypothetical protein M422DRAFT_244425 [Sphaerobolus stellatus SS14]|nr:hypothetical protein M422DRAFT_244425 [Sphaerobolus stellatus SS14]
MLTTLIPAPTSSPFSCHWDWCTLTFPSRDALVEHVENDHIAHAQPVRRADVPLLRRAEGDNVRLSWVEWSASVSGNGSISQVNGKHTTEKDGKGNGQGKEKEMVEIGVMTDAHLQSASTESSQTEPESVSTMPHPSALPPFSQFTTQDPNLAHSTPRKESPFKASFSQSQSQFLSQPQPQSHPYQISPAPAPPLIPNFTALRGETTTPPRMPPASPRLGALVSDVGVGFKEYGYSYDMEMISGIGSRDGSPSPMKMGVVMDVSITENSQEVVESQLTNSPSGSQAQSQRVESQYSPSQDVGDMNVPDTQWRPQSQLPLGGLGGGSVSGSGSLPSTIDPSQLQLPIAPPPGSPSTLDITYGSSGSDERRANLHQNMPTSSSWSQSNSQPHSQSDQMPYEEGFGFGYGEASQTQLQTQAQAQDDSMLSSSQSS